MLVVIHLLLILFLYYLTLFNLINNFIITADKVNTYPFLYIDFDIFSNDLFFNINGFIFLDYFLNIIFTFLHKCKSFNNVRDAFTITYNASPNLGVITSKHNDIFYRYFVIKLLFLLFYAHSFYLINFNDNTTTFKYI